MPDVITSRGLDANGAQLADELLQPAGNTPGVLNADWEDTSTVVLALNKTRNTATKKLADADLAEKVTMADSDNWQVLEHDPEAGLVVIVPDAAILFTTNPAASKATGGFPIAANAAFPLHCLSSPNGRYFIRRAGAGQPNIVGYGYGSRKMVYASKRIFDTASSQTA
jgi:hypothetical protein